jgi:hypothetical protein
MSISNDENSCGDRTAAKQRIGPDPATWYCKIGEIPRGLLPDNSDLPMREAITRAYREITGRDLVFIFSGWGAELIEPERAVVENRAPRV